MLTCADVRRVIPVYWRLVDSLLPVTLSEPKERRRKRKSFSASSRGEMRDQSM